MFVADVRVYIEHHLEAGGISRPRILLDLHTMDIIVTIFPSYGDSPGVFLAARGFETELKVGSYDKTAADVLESGGTIDDDDDVSWVVADSDLAVALAQLVAQEHEIEAADMLGHFNRWYHALELVRQNES